MGSLDYAVHHLASVQLLVVLGHTGCGAISAAADAFLIPATYMGITADLSLRSIVDSAMLAVCGAADALRQIYGDSARNQPNYRLALIELAVIMNAALTAAAVSQRFHAKLGPHLGVAYGVFNLQNHTVGLPSCTDGSGHVASRLVGSAASAERFQRSLAADGAQPAHRATSCVAGWTGMPPARPVLVDVYVEACQ